MKLEVWSQVRELRSDKRKNRMCNFSQLDLPFVAFFMNLVAATDTSIDILFVGATVFMKKLE